MERYEAVDLRHHPPALVDETRGGRNFTKGRGDNRDNPPDDYGRMGSRSAASEGHGRGATTTTRVLTRAKQIVSPSHRCSPRQGCAIEEASWWIRRRCGPSGRLVVTLHTCCDDGMQRMRWLRWRLKKKAAPPRVVGGLLFSSLLILLLLCFSFIVSRCSFTLALHPKYSLSTPIPAASIACRSVLRFVRYHTLARSLS